MNISFDFDKTLQRERVQNIAKDYMSDGDTIWIITRRYSDENQDVYQIADMLSIPHERVIFTEGEWKWRTIKDLPIDIHYDDKIIEVILIDKFTNTKAILI